MPPRYLYPCPHCNYTFELATKQAGQSLSCPECQAEFEAPKLGILKTLEVAANSHPATQNSFAGGIKSSLFVAGLAIAVILGTAGSLLYVYSSKLIGRVDIAKGSEVFNEEVNLYTDSQVVEKFEQMNVSDGLGEWKEQKVVRYSNQGRILQTTSYGILGLAGVGLMMLIGSFFVRQ